MSLPNPPSTLDPAGILARDVLRPVRQSAPPAPIAPVAGAGDLVARALAILEEETQAWNSRRPSTPRPRSER
jgi:hypothetical protein